MKQRFYVLGIAAVLVFALSAVALTAQDEVQTMGGGATATLLNVDGQEVGVVTFTAQGNVMVVTAALSNLPPGWHGFHVHAVGSCEDSGEGPFTAAGGHLNPDGTNHPDHAGDLPSLLVNGDGSAYFGLVTDRLTMENVFDGDGSAIIVHENRNNFAHIPERYGTPDEETLSGGDSGSRIACGVLMQGQMTGPDAGASAETGEATAEPTASG